MKNRQTPYSACAVSYFFNRCSPPLRVAALAVAALAACSGAQAQAPFLGEMRAFAFGYCPRGWVEAKGQLLPIAQNQALFAVTGTDYGGNGIANFALPHMGGRTALGQSSLHARGQSGGQDSVTLSITQMPAHTHAQLATTAAATHATPSPNALLAQSQNAGLYVAGSPNTTLTTGPSGADQPVPTRDPYLAITWCVANNGIFPRAN